MKKVSLKKFLQHGKKISGEKLVFSKEYDLSIDKTWKEQEELLKSKVIDQEVLRLSVQI